MTWFDRYIGGQQRQVWAEMMGLGSAIWDEPDALSHAEQVGRETMRRARRNAEVLVTRLAEAGYHFEPGDGLVTFAEPDPRASDELAEVEAVVGRIPLSFKWWSEEVGVVNLMGKADEIPTSADPLVVEAPSNFLAGEAEVWALDGGTEWDQGPFDIAFSPDYLHKANISGGAPYSLRTPADGVDGLVLWERHNTTFVNYLRVAFSNAGFLGWSSGTCNESRPRWLDEIADSLEVI